jgi:hypothetical protein
MYILGLFTLLFLSVFPHYGFSLHDGDKIFAEHDGLRPWYHETNRSSQVGGFDLSTGTRMSDGVPFLFTNKYTKQQAIFCLHPKAGSTNFKFLLRYATFNFGRRPVYFTLDEILRQMPHAQPASSLKHFSLALYNTRIPRIMIVRNPYIRLLSGYLDKIVKNKQISFGPPDYKLHETFEVFVDRLMYHLRYNFNPRDFNNHFRLMSTNCHTLFNMTYDYYLPLEHIQYWYEPLIRSLDLIPFVQTGWNVTTTQYHGNPNISCFYVAPNRTCTDMFQGYENRYQRGYYKLFMQRRKEEQRGNVMTKVNIDNAAAVSESMKSTEASEPCPPKNHTTTIIAVVRDDGKEESSSTSEDSHCHRKSTITVDFRSKHATGSVQQLAKYYDSKQFIDTATKWLLPDLKEYNYPIWYSHLSAEEYVQQVFSFPYYSKLLEED